ncbi:multicopper oxidase family protein [Arthrobacter sp. B3I4]|uniref:multicopper oxidase family protein n=1 Tax=Arthrobacter sp. B3I4 TaxID=3042267 RepID=UPI0027879E8B|nr:multicopper oxidase family protein [Arthrobacter sp. B3I4]MDQ0754578.1 FtsP/CotA-like multicopper oxidase with cupredoxin domain [Arthrobacter sp. B3I4]
MPPISRRNALLLGGLGVAGTVAGGAGLWWSLNSREPPVAGEALEQPTALSSAGGALEASLEAAPGLFLLAGRKAGALGYNGGIPGPTLRLRTGDVLRVRLVNKLAEPSNLHLHGLHVSPQGNGDNVFVTVESGSSFDYQYQLPAQQPPGLYWYHPHHHGRVADQVFAGLFGAIIVEDPAPPAVSSDRVLLVSDTTVDGTGNVAYPSLPERVAGREGTLVLVNGQANPRLVARPGERERWRIVNCCVARYLRLRLDGQRLQLLGMDSGRFPSPSDVQEVVLAPGNRAELLVTAAAGESVLRAVRYDRGSMPGMTGRGRRPGPPLGQDGPPDPYGTALATLVVTGEPVATATAAAAPAWPPPPDLRSAVVSARRQLVFATSMGAGAGPGMGMMDFTINGRNFDSGRADLTVAAGTVEEWTLVNRSPMDHPFHLHIWPMQPVAENGRTVETATLRDVVNVPANGQTTVRIAFRDFSGRSVYHCHILDHEDLGMMGVIEVR